MKKMKPTLSASAAVLATLMVATPDALAQGYTAEFPVSDCTFVNDGDDNAYWNLNPGYWSKLEGDDGGEFVEIRVAVLNRTKRIVMLVDGEFVVVDTRVIEEREWIDGTLVEVSENWFARCEETGDVYYFGEYVTNYPSGNHDGSWEAGKNGAMPGVIMPGSFMIGARYFQEIAPNDDALDQGENVAMGLEVSVPAGDYEDCIMIKDTTPLELDANDFKVYCPGVGIVKDETIELTNRSVPL